MPDCDGWQSEGRFLCHDCETSIREDLDKYEQFYPTILDMRTKMNRLEGRHEGNMEIIGLLKDQNRILQERIDLLEKTITWRK